MLPYVENGLVVLIGATTENPFEVNKALISPIHGFYVKTLTVENIAQILQQALSDPERGYGQLKIDIDKEALLLYQGFRVAMRVLH